MGAPPSVIATVLLIVDQRGTSGKQQLTPAADHTVTHTQQAAGRF